MLAWQTQVVVDGGACPAAHLIIPRPNPNNTTKNSSPPFASLMVHIFTQP